MKYWETKNGKEIPYNKLENSHLLNILKFIERRAKEGVWTGGGSYYGEGDNDFWEEILFGKQVKDFFNYYYLRSLAKKRGLIKIIN